MFVMFRIREVHNGWKNFKNLHNAPGVPHKNVYHMGYGNPSDKWTFSGIPCIQLTVLKY